MTAHETRPTPLDAGEIHIWYVRFADLVQPELIDRYRMLLDTDETARINRFLFDRDRRSFAISHALVRTTLSAYAEVPPTEWSFSANAYGRPEIVAPEAHRRVRFNLSHTRSGAICGVAVDCELGVDIETTERNTSCVELADRYFAPAEVADLLKQPAERQRDRFFDFWTLKEAYIKARGMGLAIPLDQFAFDLSAPRRPMISFAPELVDAPDAWQFVQWSPDEQARAAVAVRGPAVGRYRFTVRRCVPLMNVEAPRVID